MEKRSSARVLQHDHANTAEVLIVQLIFRIDAPRDGVRPVVEQIVVQLSVTAAELLLL